MKSTLVALIVFTLAGCYESSGGGSEVKAGSDASELIQRVFQADLPPGHNDAHTMTSSLMTTTIKGRFKIPEPDFEKFVESSDLLPNEIESGNPLEKISHSNIWWKPELIEDAKGLTCSWIDGNSVATCNIVSGAEEAGGDHIVYFVIVYELPNSTGERPSVHVNPNWQPKTKKFKQEVQ